ncbi:MAG TPA: ATP-binding cassette domain-containing protein, partial [Polyangiaceae bacterium]|nr:ATP-binding cassette domain-containing protein [Polyangiaceae bacterium]
MTRGIELDHVTRVVDGEDHLRDVSIRFEPGALAVVLGRTGAGKTSLLRLLAGLDRPTSGRLLAGGVDVTGVDVRRRNVAMVYQQFVNYPSLTVYENIASPLRVPGRRALAEA